MIINAHLIPQLSKQSREAIATISDYLNSDNIGFELLVQSVEVDFVRLCAWNPHKQQPETGVWADLNQVNESLVKFRRMLIIVPGFIAGVALVDLPESAPKGRAKAEKIESIEPEALQ